MAYWLYCIACQQWSKSSTPMSDDKTCSFCGKKYTKIKKNEETIIPDAEEIQTVVETETAEMKVETEDSAVPEENETFVPDETPDELEAEVVETIEGTQDSEEAETSGVVQDELAKAPEAEEQTMESQKSEAPKSKKAPSSKTSAEKKGQPGKKR
jgi:hypothetical protein